MLGNAHAIRQLGASRAAVFTGIALVLITTIPRNYDQSFLGEQPLRWLFGSLAFSLVSGTWIYVVGYGWLARRGMGGEVNRDFFSGWRSFMGLFWMTAPTAWLYAIPVERLLDPVDAAKANLALLGLVSLWRVLLIARVFQVLCGARFPAAISWVLLPALVETFCVTFLSALGPAITAGMAGLRNSPSEEVLLAAMNSITSVAFYGTPIAFVVVLFIRPEKVSPFPETVSDRIPKWFLFGTVLIWAAIAVGPQQEIQRTLKARQMIDAKRYRQAADLMVAVGAGGFSPSAGLPPKTFEWRTMQQLPGFIGVLTTNDPPWLRQVMLTKLDEMVSHTGRIYGKHTDPDDDDAYAAWIAAGIRHSVAYASDFSAMLTALERLPEGREWLGKNQRYLNGIAVAALEEPTVRTHNSKSEAVQRRDWEELHTRLNELAKRSGTNSQPAPKP